MKSHAYREVLNSIGKERPKFENPSDDFRKWLNSVALDDETREALLQNSIASELSFANGAGGIFTPSEMMDTCSNESRFISEMLLPIALAINGDWIVMDLENGGRGGGFVSHDVLWDEDPPCIRSGYILVEPVFLMFLYNIGQQIHRNCQKLSTEKAYPIDYYSGLDFVEDRTKRWN